MQPIDPRQQDIDRLIAELYDAATLPDLWMNWLASAAKCFGSNSGLALAQNKRSGSIDLLSAHNLSEHALRLYGQYYHKCDLWVQRSSGSLMKATISADLCSDEEFANSEIYTDFSKPHACGQFYVVGAVLPVADQIGVIGFQNTRDAGPFSRRHAQALDLLLPHLQRALTIRARLKESEGERAAAHAALNALSHCILLVTRAGRLIHANAAADAIVRTKDGISIGANGLLVASRLAETNELHRLIAGCALPAGGGAARLSRPSGLRPLEVIVAPLGVQGRKMISSRAAAIVFVRDPEAQPQAVPEILSKLYALTPAEARLAGDLTAHRTLELIADARRVSRETLRTQLKELFRKTGTCRQSELVGFLTSSLAAICPGQLNRSS